MITSLPVILYTRPIASPTPDWSEIDRGPGFIALPEGLEYGFRIRNIGDEELRVLVGELREVAPLAYANLSENRGISDRGLEWLAAFPQLVTLNLSSCNLTDEGMVHLLAFRRLTNLDLSYCNRLTGAALKPLRGLASLSSLNLQGCVKIKTGDVARFRRPGLVIRK
jgi:hypothetical protein